MGTGSLEESVLQSVELESILSSALVLDVGGSRIAYC